MSEKNSSFSERHLDPCSVVIFGASGDLTKRKLVPALYTLAVENHLPESVAIVGVARRELDFHQEMRQGVEQFSRHGSLIQQEDWESFSGRLSYLSGDFADSKTYESLQEHLNMLDQTHGTQKNRIFYIATPPEYFEVIVRMLGQHGMIEKGDKPFTRVIIEKPFGHDAASAYELNKACLEVLKEEQIFRIDHYLGKETVQNILFFRFANGIFEPLWNQKYIDHVQITVAESIGIEGRGGYYDKTGALRDMIQNHLFQLLSLVAMEPPVLFSAKAVRDEKVKVFQALRELSIETMDELVVRGQYTSSQTGPAASPAYREESDVAKDSKTETYVALKLLIDNWRWGGVPFYIRTGKKMPKRVSEISIVFRSVPHALFSGILGHNLPIREPNVLTLRIQPDEGIGLTILSKAPGPNLFPESVTMDFRYGTQFQKQTPEAYERLLLDALLGDGTLFIRGDEILASWNFCDRILEAWQMQDRTSQDTHLQFYEAGTAGPLAADLLLAKDGRAWRVL